MRRLCLPLLLFLIIASLPLTAETVLVFTRNSLDPEAYAVAELQAALEDGVMEAFFDAGHIVFNAGVVAGNDTLDIPSERLSFRLAKSGGALYLLEIDMYYRPLEEALEVTGAEYRYYDVRDGSILAEGNYSDGEIRSSDDETVEEICTAMGESIASGALASMRM